MFLDDFLHLDPDIFSERQEVERNVTFHNFVDLFLKAPRCVPSHQGLFHDSTTNYTRFVKVVVIFSVCYWIRILDDECAS